MINKPKVSQKLQVIKIIILLVTGQAVTVTNPDQINIDSEDDDDVMTSNTVTNNNDFLPLDTSCTGTQGTENRKRLHNDNDNNVKRNVVIKRRNASLYQSQDNDDSN